MTDRPFTNFRFRVLVRRSDDENAAPLCSGAFAECSGLNATTTVKPIRSGGDHRTQIQLSGPVAYGQLQLKRGVTASTDLWKWFTEFHDGDSRGNRAAVDVEYLSADGREVTAHFRLLDSIPASMRAPALNAASTETIAIEEISIAYQRLEVLDPAEVGGSNG